MGRDGVLDGQLVQRNSRATEDLFDVGPVSPIQAMPRRSRSTSKVSSRLLRIGASPAVHVHRIVPQGHSDLEPLSEESCAVSR